MLKHLMSMLAALALMWTPCIAQSLQETQVREVISAQVEAFKRDDAAAAYSFASPEIQAQFPDATAFIGMVQRGFPEVYRPHSLRFLRLETESDGRIVQRVLVQGAGGTIVTAVYEMIEIGGKWRINGCTFLRGADI